MKRLIILISAISLCYSAFAQNSKLNPTVQVTNAYQAKLKEVEKSTLPTFVPDSIYHFDLNFDYSGFENPYKGTDEFNPFKTELDIAPKQLSYRKFYLKAGAGYTISPFLDMAWSFKPKGAFKAGLYATHDSYFGDMYNSNPFNSEAGVYNNSMDGKTRVGTDMRWDFEKLYMVLDAGYDGVFARLGDGSSYKTSFYNAGTAKFMLRSNNNPGVSRCNFGVDAAYSFGSRAYNENNNDLGGYLDFYSGKHGFGLDVDVNSTSGKPRWKDAEQDGDYSAFCVTARPRFSLNTQRVALIVGVGLYYAKSSNSNITAFENTLKFPVLPYLDFSWKAVPEHLDLYAVIDGEQKVWGERENALQSRFMIADSQRSVIKDLSARVGARGNIADCVQYDLRAGWQDIVNAPLYGVFQNASDGRYVQDICIVHRDALESIYAAARIDAVFGCVNFGGNVKYSYYYDTKPEVEGAVNVIPPAWNAGAYFGLNFKKRINFKLGADYVSEYRSYDYIAPSYVNLYAEFEYRFSPKAGFYLRGENLLGKECQFIPLFARKGICATAGFVLNF